ncbi:Uncharacterised protein [Moraxella lacunata]|uniref:Uncharacterized protein n=1 Tax=Moraxella lacunata TaxID=477 RepID=A0A378TTI2_MORLA|nr:hypothetical protein [Moraxella lacunata]STZ63941.1 Uncharacterised protein [Moraxella lacunata]
MATFYTKKDKDAPAVSTAVDVINFIKAALVVGYGDKPAAGWRLLYDSNAEQNQTTRRIIIRSDSAASEQKIYEFAISGSQLMLNAYHTYDETQKTAVGLWHSIVVNLAAINGDRMEVCADEKFCLFGLHGMWQGFGDYISDNTQYTQSILFGSNINFFGAERQSTLSSTNNPNNILIKDADGNTYVCRSYSREEAGYGSRIGWSNAVIHANVLREGSTPRLLKTELMLKTDRGYAFAGYMPFLYYADYNITDFKNVKNIKVIDANWYHSGGLYLVL